MVQSFVLLALSLLHWQWCRFLCCGKRNCWTLQLRSVEGAIASYLFQLFLVFFISLTTIALCFANWVAHLNHFLPFGVLSLSRNQLVVCGWWERWLPFPFANDRVYSLAETVLPWLKTQVGYFVRIECSHLTTSSGQRLLPIVAVWQSLLRIWIRLYQKNLRGLIHLQSNGVALKCTPWIWKSTVKRTSWTVGHPRLMSVQFFRWTLRFLVTDGKRIPLSHRLLLVVSSGWCLSPFASWAIINGCFLLFTTCNPTCVSLEHRFSHLSVQREFTLQSRS